jgi:hypothetical protein
MRRIAVLWLLMVAVLLALSYNAPRAGAFASPELTPTIETHFRPTPTGWPDAPFSWETPRAQKAHSQLARDNVATPANLPTPTLAPLTRIRPRVAATVIERRNWTLWEKHNRD